MKKHLGHKVMMSQATLLLPIKLQKIVAGSSLFSVFNVNMIRQGEECSRSRVVIIRSDPLLMVSTRPHIVTHSRRSLPNLISWQSTLVCERPTGALSSSQAATSRLYVSILANRTQCSRAPDISQTDKYESCLPCPSHPFMLPTHWQQFECAIICNQ